MMPSDTMQVGLQGGGIQVSSGSRGLGSGSEVHDVFSNRDLPATSLGQDKNNRLHVLGVV